MINKSIRILSCLLFLCVQPLAAQDDPVEYVPTKLSDTVTMLKGKGGNMAVSAGVAGVFIIDDQLKPLTEQLLAANILASFSSEDPERVVEWTA